MPKNNFRNVTTRSDGRKAGPKKTVSNTKSRNIPKLEPIPRPIPLEETSNSAKTPVVVKPNLKIKQESPRITENTPVIILQEELQPVSTPDLTSQLLRKQLLPKKKADTPNLDTKTQAKQVLPKKKIDQPNLDTPKIPAKHVLPKKKTDTPKIKAKQVLPKKTEEEDFQDFLADVTDIPGCVRKINVNQESTTTEKKDDSIDSNLEVDQEKSTYDGTTEEHKVNLEDLLNLNSQEAGKLTLI